MMVLRRRFALLLGLAVALTGLAAGPLRAQTVEEFYRGRTIELYVGYSVGAGYDTHMRLVARHFGKHLPGKPVVVPMNMEGAGNLKLVNWLYNVAPRDGSVLALVARGIPFEPLVGVGPPENLRFDAKKFTWIGSTTNEASVCVAWSRSGIRRFTDLFERELIIGGIGAGSDADVFPRVVSGALGAKFRMVSGYPGGADVVYAMERGEVDGRCGWSWTSLLADKPEWLKDKNFTVLLQLAQEPHPELTAMGVPWVMDFAKTDEQKQMLQLMLARLAMGRPYIAPPGIPADRVAALRRAFDATMRDPAFLQEAARARLEVTPMTGEQAHALIEKIYATPRPLVEKARAMMQP
jgi:tripartite-type tricarboxylate transporter receptor subunit TctC